MQDTLILVMLFQKKIETWKNKSKNKSKIKNFITKDMGGNNSTEEVIKNVVLNIMS